MLATRMEFEEPQFRDNDMNFCHRALKSMRQLTAGASRFRVSTSYITPSPA